MNAPALAVDQLSFTFAGRVAPTLEEISFSLEPGSWTVLAGRSGSGKSTLLRAAAGLIPHHSAGVMQGAVRLFGRDTRHCNPQELANLAGVVLQSPDDQICTTTAVAEIAFGLENLALPPEEIGRRVDEALDRLDMAERPKQSTQQLSGGQKQRLALAAIMAMRPKLLMLDEPLSQLDAASVAELLEELSRLRQTGLTILFIEHRLDEVLGYADRVLVIDQGRLLDDVSVDQTDRLCASLAAAGLAPPETMQLAQAVGRKPVLSIDALCESLAPGEKASRTHENSDAAASSVPATGEGQTLLRVASLAVGFPRAAQPVFREVSFALRAGERVAVAGPNGSGKSTLLAALAGLLKPNSGTIETSGEKRPACALVLQNPDLSLFCNSVREELSFGPRQMAADEAEIAARVSETAAHLDLSDMLDEPPLALSQGQRLRVAVGALLTLQPQLLLLDEPTTGQDQPLVARLLDAVAGPIAESQTQALLFSTHDLRSLVRYADRVLVLSEGRLLADCTPEALLEDDALLAAARLRRTPLFEVRRHLGLRGRTVAGLAEELRP
ncbi:MAG TPA: ATP-binding cassette domain-containing protein [Pirellulales bacterium]|nr:ATP-binding cassette domain-containing protein [Pirellulales bacterium]